MNVCQTDPLSKELPCALISAAPSSVASCQKPWHTCCIAASTQVHLCMLTCGYTCMCAYVCVCACTYQLLEALFSSKHGLISLPATTPYDNQLHIYPKTCKHTSAPPSPWLAPLRSVHRQLQLQGSCKPVGTHVHG